MRACVKLAVPFLGLFLMMAQNAAGQINRPAKQACENSKTQLEMNQCTAAAYEAADKELNTFYASVKKKLDAPLLRKLQSAQKAWINYRDADCAAQSAPYEGGSIQPAVHFSCLERVTRARIAELRAMYDPGIR